MLLCLGFLSSTMKAGTRVTFFLYPIMLLLVFSTVAIIAKSLSQHHIYTVGLTIFTTLALISSTEDFNISHIIHIDSPEVNFRKIYYDKKATISHYIARRDYRAVADVINREAEEEDLVISTLQTVHYYTNKIDYIFHDTEHQQFWAYTSAKGTKERWTNLDLIYQTERLYDMVDTAKSTVWIVLNIRDPKSGEIRIFERYGNRIYFLAQDESLVILRLAKNKTNQRKAKFSLQHLPL
jgi:hypothetical protein